MNLKNVKQKLEKVNRFYDYLDANQEITSRVDRDALIVSIRALYEACFEEEVASAAKVTAPQIHKTTPSATKPKETDTNKKRPKLVFNTETTNTALEEKPTAREPKQEPVVEKPVEPSVEKTVVKEVPQKQEAAPEVEPEVINKAETPSSEFNEDYDGLFLFKEATDLSQKLSATPLKDLNKALGLNEKFLYINELFGGDVAKFQAAIKVLNDEKDFDTARSYIESELVETYTWMKKVKQPIAKDFVKLVRRRYL